MEVTSYVIIWHSVFILGMIPTVLGNGLIILSVVRFVKLQSSMNILVANLAVADLLVGAILTLASMVGDYLRFTTNNKYFCLVKLALFNTSIRCSCYNLLLVSVERYISITLPLYKHRYLTKTRMVIMIVFGWILNTVNSSLPLFGWNTYTGNTTSCISDEVWERGYKLYTNWLFLITNIINITLYGIVMRAALKRAKSSGLENQSNVRTRSKRDLRHLKTMIIIFGLFAICWMPYLVVAMVVTVHETEHVQFARRCTLILGYSNSALNWMVYGYRNKDFRNAFVKILRLERCCKQQQGRRSTFVSVSHIRQGTGL